jgi:hypothetical protein
MRVFLQEGQLEGARKQRTVRANDLAGSAALFESLATQPTAGRPPYHSAVREQSQIEAMREALRGDRERAEARRKAGRSGVPRVPPPTGQEGGRPSPRPRS